MWSVGEQGRCHELKMVGQALSCRVRASAVLLLFLSITTVVLQPARASSSSSSSSDHCGDELYVCLDDEDCYACFTAILSDGGEEAYEECVANFYQGYGVVDFCYSVSLNACCDDELLPEVDCLANSAFSAYNLCIMNYVARGSGEEECSALTCVDPGVNDDSYTYECHEEYDACLNDEGCTECYHLSSYEDFEEALEVSEAFEECVTDRYSGTSFVTDLCYVLSAQFCCMDEVVTAVECSENSVFVDLGMCVLSETEKAYNGEQECTAVTCTRGPIGSDENPFGGPTDEGEPEPARPGKAAAVLASVVVVSTAVLTALAAPLVQSIPIKTGGGKAVTGTGKTSPDVDVDTTEESSRNETKQDAIITADNPVAEGESTKDTGMMGGGTQIAATADNPVTQGGSTKDTGAVSGGGPGDDADERIALLLAAGSLPSTRSPSSTLVWLMVVQAQFLAVLSLVDSVGSEDSWLSDFLKYLRWLNLWVSVGEGEDDSQSEKDNDLDEGEFVGNMVTLWVTGLLILVLHILLVSAIEAYWLESARQRDNMAEARTGFADDPLPAPSHEEVVAGSERDAAGGGGGGAAKEQHDLEAIAKCRQRSSSMWIHFPHVELVFLLYAVQGSLAAQVEVLRHGDGAVLFVAAIALVVYPMFMIGMACRVIFFRVRTDAGGMTFTLTRKDERHGRGCLGFFSRVFRGLKEECSVFAWATKGVWRTADTQNAEDRRMVDWFRIGFEPLFADFTQSGSWFAVYALLEAYVIACIGVLVDSSSRLQLLIFMGLNLVGLVLVAYFRPFANSVIDVVAASRLGLNAVCMGLLVVAEMEDVTEHATRIETAVGVIELLFMLLALSLPVFLDTVTALVAAAYRAVNKATTCCGVPNDPREASGSAEVLQKEDTGRFVAQDWRATWFTMIRRNVAAYATDVANGLRHKVHSNLRVHPTQLSPQEW